MLKHLERCENFIKSRSAFDFSEDEIESYSVCEKPVSHLSSRNHNNSVAELTSPKDALLSTTKTPLLSCTPCSTTSADSTARNVSQSFRSPVSLFGVSPSSNSFHSTNSLTTPANFVESSKPPKYWRTVLHSTMPSNDANGVKRVSTSPDLISPETGPLCLSRPSSPACAGLFLSYA